MKYKELLKKINFCTNILNAFDNYASNLDKYFEDDINKQEHIDLYNYYQQQKNNLIEVKKGY